MKSLAMRKTDLFSYHHHFGTNNFKMIWVCFHFDFFNVVCDVYPYPGGWFSYFVDLILNMLAKASTWISYVIHMQMYIIFVECVETLWIVGRHVKLGETCSSLTSSLVTYHNTNKDA